MSKNLNAKLEVTKVRLGQEWYSVQLKVTMTEQDKIDPEVGSFMNTLTMLRQSQQSFGQQLQRQRSESAPVELETSPTDNPVERAKLATTSAGKDPLKQKPVNNDDEVEIVDDNDESSLEAVIQGLS